MILAQQADNLQDISSQTEGHILIKVILILLLLLVLRAFLVQRSLILAKRLSAIILFLVLVVLVIFPEVSNWAAHRIGVGRGVDLLFYLSHLFLLLLIVGLWRRINVLTDTMTRLSRQIAIYDSSKPEDRNPAHK